MRTVNMWLDEYAESHRNSKNKFLHWICVPVIVVSVIGLLWALPVPQALREISPWLNWGTLVLVAGLVYYFALSPRLGFGMVLVLAAVALAVRWLEEGFATPLWVICVTLFVVAWIGQFIGHIYEG